MGIIRYPGFFLSSMLLVLVLARCEKGRMGGSELTLAMDLLSAVLSMCGFCNRSANAMSELCGAMEFDLALSMSRAWLENHRNCGFGVVLVNGMGWDGIWLSIERIPLG